MEQIRIKPHFSVLVHGPDLVELRHGVWNNASHVLNDENKEGVLGKILLGLGKKENPASIAKQLNISRSKIEAVLDHLQTLGVLETKPSSFIDHYIENVIPAFRRPGTFEYEINKPILLIGNHAINKKIETQLNQILTLPITHDEVLWKKIEEGGDEWLFDALLQQQFIDAFQTWKGKFIVFTATHLHPILATRVNRIAFELNIPWIHLIVDGPFVFVGPTFYGQQGPCYDCFETRVSMNLRESDSYKNYKNAIATKNFCQTITDELFQVETNLLATHACIEILNYLITECTFTNAKTLSIFMPTMEFVYHDIIKLPACRTCGSVTHRDETQLYFDFQKLIEVKQ